MTKTIDNKNEEDKTCPICGMVYHNKITVSKTSSKYKVRDDAEVCKSGHDAQAKEDWYIHVEVNKHL